MRPTRRLYRIVRLDGVGPQHCSISGGLGRDTDLPNDIILGVVWVTHCGVNKLMAIHFNAEWQLQLRRALVYRRRVQ